MPIGPNNHFEPGDPDRGQPTHFLPNRNFGMFTITVPKNTPVTEKLWWVLTVNGVTQRVPFYMSPDYNITPQQASEEGPGGKYNRPPILRFAEGGPADSEPGRHPGQRHRADRDGRRADAARPLGGRRRAVCQRIERADQRAREDRRCDRQQVPRPRQGHRRARATRS